MKNMNEEIIKKTKSITTKAINEQPQKLTKCSNDMPIIPIITDGNKGNPPPFMCDMSNKAYLLAIALITALLIFIGQCTEGKPAPKPEIKHKSAIEMPKMKHESEWTTLAETHIQSKDKVMQVEIDDMMTVMRSIDWSKEIKIEDMDKMLKEGKMTPTTYAWLKGAIEDMKQALHNAHYGIDDQSTFPGIDFSK